MTGSIIVAVDPGLAPASCGIARLHIDGHVRRCLVAYVLKLKKTDDHQARMQEVTARVCDELMNAALLVIEDQKSAYFASVGKKNAASSKLDKLVGMLQGVAVVLSKPVQLVTPQQVRARLGLHRGASKQTVWNRACTILRGYPIVKSQHARDAMAIGIAGEMMWRVDSMGRRAS